MCPHFVLLLLYQRVSYAEGKSGYCFSLSVYVCVCLLSSVQKLKKTTDQNSRQLDRNIIVIIISHETRDRQHEMDHTTQQETTGQTNQKLRLQLPNKTVRVKL